MPNPANAARQFRRCYLTKALEILRIPRLPQIPRIPQIPWIPQIPRLPRIPQIPWIPRIPRIPRMPPTSLEQGFDLLEGFPSGLGNKEPDEERSSGTDGGKQQEDSLGRDCV